MSEPTLTDFLLARIAEDEAVARAVPAPYMTGERFSGRFDSWESDHSDEDRAFVDRHDPARVLAECEAKRRIVEREGKRLHEEWRRRSDEHRQTFEEWFTKPYGETLRDLALPYADHEDYRAEWKP